MLIIKNLSKTYEGNKERTLKNINLTIENKGLYAILGKSGSGKTTLLSIIGGMDLDFDGNVTFNGSSLNQMSEKELEDYRYKNISFVFQDFNSSEEETVKENLLKVLDIENIKTEEKVARIKKVLKRVGLLENEKSIFKDLSGGEKKRVSLARGLLKDTPLLLLDEPLSSLNKKLREEVTKILIEESKRKAVIYITHDKEELSDEANIYQITNGVLSKVRDGILNTKGEYKELKERNRIKTSLKEKLRTSISFFKTHHSFLFMVLFSYIIALFSISFSIQLSSSVSKSMVESFSNYMDDNSMVVERKDQGLTSDSLMLCEYQKLVYLENTYPENVISSSDFYIEDIDTYFDTMPLVQAFYQSSTFKLSRYNLTSFTSYSMFDEEEISYTEELNYDEIALLSDEDTFRGLHKLILGYIPSTINDTDVNNLNKSLQVKNISVLVKASKSTWNYKMEHSFRLRRIFLGEECRMLHSKSDFSLRFVSDVLHFKDCYQGEEKESEWTLYKVSGLRLYKDRISDFIIKMINDRNLDGYIPTIVKEHSYYLQDDTLTHNRISIYKDFIDSFSVSDIEDFRKENNEDISSVSYSTNVYTYTASGYICGFSKPFFFSRYKEKLNQIQDDNHQSDVNLGSFQSSLIEVDESVIKADLLSSVNGNSLSLSNIGDETLLYGNEPKVMPEIGITFGLAKKLYSNPSEALGEYLYTLTLNKTEKIKDGLFENDFSESKMKITAIYEGEEEKIVADPLFTLAYLFPQGKLSIEDLRINNAVIKVNLSKKSSDDYINMIRKGGKYTASFPMLVMVQEIRKTLNTLSLLFFILALLSIISSALLLSLALYLIIQKDRKNIGVLLSLGYRKQDLYEYYFFIAIEIGVVSYVSSLGISLFAEKALKDVLIDTLSSYVFNITPFIISLLTMLLMSVFITLVIAVPIRKITPKEALKNK